MKVVHINKQQIKEDTRVAEMAEILVEKWTRRRHARLVKQNRLPEESLKNNSHERGLA